MRSVTTRTSTKPQTTGTARGRLLRGELRFSVAAEAGPVPRMLCFRDPEAKSPLIVEDR
jgi:hypothetical protein